MNQNTHRWYVVAAGLLVIVAVVAWYFMSHQKALAPSTNNLAATSTMGTATGQTSPLQVTGVPDTSTIPEPNLNRPYTPLSSLPASVQAQEKQQVATAVQQLKIDPNHLAYWLQLAIYRKGANDFTGAEDIWIYCTKRWTTDPTSYENLGDLYANYMHEPAQGVAYWNKAIPLDAHNIQLYINLATYQDINLQNKAAAQATLQAGLKSNPGNPDIQYALDHLQ